jgi:peptide-methionine (S)-S-oxide reductase
MFGRIQDGVSRVLILAAVACSAATAATGPIPAPLVDVPLAAAKGQQTAVLAGGCFWGIQAVFQHVRGVTRATSGYSGGAASTAHYDIVSTGRSGHAESVLVVYDPSLITYGQILRLFFSVAHDPTQLNRQGPDEGTQYRSAVFYADPEQARIAQAYVTQLNQAGVFRKPIVTQVVPLKAFYAAEDHHQDYAAHHPYDPYIMINDAPKVKNLHKEFPELYVSK